MTDVHNEIKTARGENAELEAKDDKAELGSPIAKEVQRDIKTASHTRTRTACVARRHADDVSSNRERSHGEAFNIGVGAAHA